MNKKTFAIVALAVGIVSVTALSGQATGLIEAFKGKDRVIEEKIPVPVPQIKSDDFESVESPDGKNKIVFSVDKLDQVTGTTYLKSTIETLEGSIETNFVTSIFPFTPQNVPPMAEWLSSEKVLINGEYIFDVSQRTGVSLKNQMTGFNKPFSYCVSFDKQKLAWIGKLEDGSFVIRTVDLNTMNYKDNLKYKLSVVGDFSDSIAWDKNGNLFLSTFDGETPVVKKVSVEGNTSIFLQNASSIQFSPDGTFFSTLSVDNYYARKQSKAPETKIYDYNKKVQVASSMIPGQVKWSKDSKIAGICRQGKLVVWSVLPDGKFEKKLDKTNLPESTEIRVINDSKVDLETVNYDNNGKSTRSKVSLPLE